MWDVLDEESRSDHSSIYFEVSAGTAQRRQKEQDYRPKTNWNKFRLLLEWKTQLNPDLANDFATYMKVTKESLIDSTAKGKHSKAREMPYWWCEDIENKTPVQSSKDGLTTCDLKRNSELWHSVCRELDENIWGQGYKIALKMFNALHRYELDLCLFYKRRKRLPGDSFRKQH
nr:unnamed protein product [Callosobruchus chinensis]